MEQIYIFISSLQLNFQKTSCILEISNHLYCKSFQNFYNSDQSFNLLKELLVRHSLFKPPDSIQIFDLDDIKEISNFFLYTFYRHYDLYFFANTPSINFEVRTFDIFKSRFPYTDTLAEAQPVARTEIPLLQQYLVDKETGLTPEQLEEIMKGDSIHMVPAKKREEWMRLKKERERQARIDKVIKKEVERLNIIFEEKIKIQDEAFLEGVNAIKNPKKK
ncbi:hypothetical protein IMG5_183560 [Ichthyophthirius multifiliis]|uniref:Uncharacterized protein n=1 Tax=Ichthyophthirius multifiliis TaxID=5932 RepID=G0R376_ICHMU|nr:hypothetical protein IMG5_183560 [Ichthyophthirius multifiliis]EGR28099.1 hypothetical protein IMG5_183560 [Ichthyophthirius multifiliis]|eukprot:XP_004027444.1 hypothetical protein IMG5_183560 [Ichthyophthirius multifiliis]